MYWLVQILPDVPEPPAYWQDSDPRAEAAHLRIISQMVLDFQPFSSLNNKGFLIDKRLTMPNLQIHTPWWYQDEICVNYIIIIGWTSIGMYAGKEVRLVVAQENGGMEGPWVGPATAQNLPLVANRLEKNKG